MSTPTKSKPVVKDGAKDVDVLRSQNEMYEAQIHELRSRLIQVAMFQNELEYQPYIDAPPVKDKSVLYKQACSSDGPTLDTWLDTWIRHIEVNNKRYSFSDNSVMQDFAKFAYRPGIVAGSGPSLKKNAEQLKDRGDMPLVSCLHNFGFLEDLGCPADYYINLDAGNITIPEMSEGGKEKAEHYWERTKERTLVTAITGNPDLIKRWKGRVLFYGVIAPAQKFVDAVKAITDFKCPFSVGGNSLGACLYMAKSILGCNPIAYVGADFCFGYNKKFHSWDSNYDTQYSGLMRWTDVYGNSVATWPSYFNFKNWFDYIACGGQGNQPGMYINCTEGGILGAYKEGNIRQIQQMPLKAFLFTYNLHRQLPEILKNENQPFPLLF